MADETEDCGCDDAAGEFAAVTAVDEDADGIAAPDADEPDPRGTKITRWRSLLAPVGVYTGDNRRFKDNALVNRELPLPLKWQRTDQSGHTTSVVIGTIDKIAYADNGAPTGEGLLFDPDPAQLPRLAEDVNEFKMLAKDKVVGPSVDLDSMEFTVDQPEGEMSADAAPGAPQKRPKIDVTQGRISAVTMVPIPAFAETGPTFEMWEVDAESPEARPSLAASGAVRTIGWQDLQVADPATTWDPVGATERLATWAADPEAYGQAFLLRDLEQLDSLDGYRFPIADVAAGGDLVIVPQAVTAALSILDSQPLAVDDHARRQLRVQLEEIAERIEGDRVNALAASSAPVAPPAEWFADPKLPGPTRLTITPDGRVFGHLADWKTCHTGIPGRCTLAPKSRTDYAYFHTGTVTTAEGEDLAVGRVSLGGGHADRMVGFRAAAEHYDATSTCVATVRAGQDKHGVWVAGSLVPGLDEFKIAELKRSPLSGDWRTVGGNLELVHALAVNSPGFPIVPAIGMVAGAQVSLVAAGVLHVDESAEVVVSPDGSVDIAAVVSSAVAQGIAQGLRAVRSSEDAEEAAQRREAEAEALRASALAEAEDERQQAALGLLDGLEGDFAANDELKRQQRARELLAAF